MATKSAPRKKEFKWTQRDRDIMTLPVNESAKKYNLTSQQVYSRRFTVVKYFDKNYKKAAQSAKASLTPEAPINSTSTPSKNEKLKTSYKQKQQRQPVSQGMRPMGAMMEMEINGVNFKFQPGTRLSFKEGSVIFGE